MSEPAFQPYGDAADDALADVLSMVDDILTSGNYWAITWTEDELKELKRWLEKRTENQ